MSWVGIKKYNVKDAVNNVYNNNDDDENENENVDEAKDNVNVNNYKEWTGRFNKDNVYILKWKLQNIH